MQQVTGSGSNSPVNTGTDTSGGENRLITARFCQPHTHESLIETHFGEESAQNVANYCGL